VALLLVILAYCFHSMVLRVATLGDLQMVCALGGAVFIQLAVAVLSLEVYWCRKVLALERPPTT
jgi:hypothetical protein